MHIGLRVFIALLILVFGFLQAGVAAEIAPIMKPVFVFVTLAL